jgi:hypothetical protein
VGLALALPGVTMNHHEASPPSSVVLRRPRVAIGATLLLLPLLALVACGDGGGAVACDVGSESCPCTAGGACDPGLVCLSDTCVVAAATGSGGASGVAGATGTAGATGAAGNTGAAGSTGGAVGTGGGAPVSGGAGSSGAAGVTGTGGTGPVGGRGGSGMLGTAGSGSLGTGGMAGRGGAMGMLGSAGTGGGAGADAGGAGIAGGGGTAIGTGGRGGTAGTGSAGTGGTRPGTLGGRGGGNPAGSAGTGGTSAACTVGRTECAGDTQVRTCTAAGWATSNCANYNVCVANACQPVCDGMLAAATAPAVCFFPMSGGLFYWSNNTAKFAEDGNAVAGLVSDGQAQLPIHSASGTTWPYYWSMSYPTDGAIVGFSLARFTFPVREARMYYKVKRAGIISAITNQLYVASNNTTTIGSATAAAPLSWRVDEFYVSGVLTQNFNYDAKLNFMQMAVTGDGFGGFPDLLDLNWFMLKVTQ